MVVERTVSRWEDGKWATRNEKLADFRSARAYVLLGEAGSGKTTAFDEETRDGEEALKLSARRFIRRSVAAHPEWRGGTLFIDGLDEVRAGGGDPREPLDALLCRLEQLGRPRFRLSCREDSWLGRNDFRELSDVLDGEELPLLRLDPLSGRDARRILRAAGERDPDAFLWDAADRGLEVFLQNPLLLDILRKARASGAWPDGRLATFERACEELARERNREHLDAGDGSSFANDEVVLGVGRLCAILLLCGTAGWTRRGAGDDRYPALSEAGEEQPLLKCALDTKLFEGSAETGRRPRHRQIAEFLAAKSLDHVIRSRRLPATRVLAWMRGIDGIVMPDLRGVSAWLAARNPDIRHPLIESDPIAVAFHGDAGNFSHSDTALLLNSLETHLEHQWEWASPASLGALMAGRARDLLWDMLRDENRSHVRQALVEILLRGLTASPASVASANGLWCSMAAAPRILLSVVRDDTWRSTARHWALIALMRVLEGAADGPRILLGLLGDMHEGRVAEDERGELRGELLTHLYPGHIDPEHVWHFVRSGPVPTGKARMFWTKHLADESSPDDVRTLLDTLVANTLSAETEKLVFLLAQNNVESAMLRLLARGLELFGEEMEVTKLYDWFALVEADYERAGLIPAHCQAVVLRSRGVEEEHRIYNWLRDHRRLQLALILEGLRRNVSGSRNTAWDQRIGVKFLGDGAPLGFRRWCLDKAVELATTEPDVAIELATWSVIGRDEWGSPLEDEEVLTAVRRVPRLKNWHEQRLAAEARHAAEFAQLRKSRPYIQVRERLAARSASVRRHVDAITAGRGPPAMLHDLGRVYLNGLEAGGPDQARSDLALHLDSDEGLLEAVVRGLRRLVARRDLPSLSDIIRLYGQGQMSWYAAPFLAGLSEKERAGADPLERFDEAGLRRALAFYLLSRLPTRRHPDPRILSHWEDCRPLWYRRALRIHPVVVADVLVAVHAARVRAKELPDQHLYDLVNSEEYAPVARVGLPRMFTPFPSCCTESQIDSLRPTLWAAINHMPASELAELVRRRLARRGVDGHQRILWLAVGAIINPDARVPELADFVSRGGEHAVRHLVYFLVPDVKALPTRDWPTSGLAALVRAVGAKMRSPWDRHHGRSDQFMGGESFAAGVKAQPLMDDWVNALADRVDEDAVAELASLAGDPALKHWRGMLVRKQHEQARKRRVSAYNALTVREIRKALRGGSPAGSADLAALVTDKLNTLAERIRHGNTDDWIQYWQRDRNDAKRRNVVGPELEDPCRDALLSDLQLLLDSHEVDAQPEGHHAEDARSDIIAVSGTHAVPVEIKKSNSRDLWSAIRDQLPKYLRDPRSGGYGIYLVFWFGSDYLKVSPPSGARPRSPEQLREALRESLSPEQRRMVAVIVVDVSAPPGRRVAAAATRRATA